MQGKQLLQMLRALELLSSPGGTTIKRLAEGLEINPRSVYRLLHMMEEMGFPIWDEKPENEKEKRWRLEESYLQKFPNIKLPRLDLTYPEVMALYLISRDRPIFRGTEIETHINSAFYKISTSLPGDIGDALKRLKDMVVAKSTIVKNYRNQGSTIQLLARAIIACESCILSYDSYYDNSIKEMKVDPLHFFENFGGLYLMARKTGTGDYRTLAVERILSISSTGEEFRYPEGFDPQERLDAAFDIIAGETMHVKIWFSSGQARYIKERQWAPSQEIIGNDDGSIFCHLVTSGRRDIKKWVLSWGSDAVLLEPADLADEIREETRRMLESQERWLLN